MTTKFQAFMDAHQLSQYRLHKLTGFSKSQISEWQRCKHRPSKASAYRIAAALGLSARTVLDAIETREVFQNARTPEGTFVARTKANSRAIAQTNDAARTRGAYCRLCRQVIQDSASTLPIAA
jgi:transcriptional regulator with XRE-family HTH domain